MTHEYMQQLPGGYDGPEEPMEAVMRAGDVMCAPLPSLTTLLCLSLPTRPLLLHSRQPEPLCATCRFWHHWMVHASSINCSDTVRQAVIARFHSTKYGLALLSDDGGVASDGNLWKYWGPEVREGPEPDPAAVEGFAASWQLLDSPPPAVRHPLDRGEGDLERCVAQRLPSSVQANL